MTSFLYIIITSFRPFVLLPALTDDVRAAAKALTTTEDDKHLLEDAVAAYGVATLKKFFYRNEHCAGVGEVEVVRVTFDDNAFQHPPLAMNQAIADGFSQGFVSGCLVKAAVALLTAHLPETFFLMVLTGDTCVWRFYWKKTANFLYL